MNILKKLCSFRNFCPYTIDLDYYKDIRQEFNVHEWIDIILGAVDYNADGYKDEHEKLSAELHDSILKELTEKFAAEYENKVKQLTAEFDAEYEKKLKEESDKLAQEYESKIAEIERQKDSEMKAWIKENKKQALEETNARTER